MRGGARRPKAPRNPTRRPPPKLLFLCGRSRPDVAEATGRVSCGGGGARFSGGVVALARSGPRRARFLGIATATQWCCVDSSSQASRWQQWAGSREAVSRADLGAARQPATDVCENAWPALAEAFEVAGVSGHRGSGNSASQRRQCQWQQAGRRQWHPRWQWWQQHRAAEPAGCSAAAFRRRRRRRRSRPRAIHWRPWQWRQAHLARQADWCHAWHPRQWQQSHPCQESWCVGVELAVPAAALVAGAKPRGDAAHEA